MMSGEATAVADRGLADGLAVCAAKRSTRSLGAVEIMRKRWSGSLHLWMPSILSARAGMPRILQHLHLRSLCRCRAGLKVAKHGNRALSSKSGAADVLTALGVKIDLAPEQISGCIAQAGLGFMFAPAHHASMKHVGPTRVELGTRTIFNLLGPLSNPAGVRRQVTGVFSKAWVEPLAQVLKNLGSESCWICHGEGGFDEIVPSGTTWVSALSDGRIESFEITPEAVGLKRSKIEISRAERPPTTPKRFVPCCGARRMPSAMRR